MYTYDRTAAGPLPEVRFKASVPADVKKRVEAYRLLFEVEPKLRVSGTLKAKDGDLVFLKRDELVVKVGASFEVDLGEEEGTAMFSFSENADAARFMISGR